MTKQRIDARLEPTLLADIKAAAVAADVTVTSILEDALRRWLRASRRGKKDRDYTEV